jgi:hypothetical protein
MQQVKKVKTNDEAWLLRMDFDNNINNLSKTSDFALE